MSQPAATGFYKPQFMMGTFVGVVNQPVNGVTDNRMLVDWIPADSHALGYQFPVVLPFGLARRPRQGQFGASAYALGHPQSGYVFGHSFNNDTDPKYADQYPVVILQPGGLPGDDYADDTGNIIPNVDDLALYHDETGAFWRFRSVSNASPTQSGPLGGPAIAELRMRSGVIMHFEEYPLGNPPPPPPQPPSQAPAKPLAQPQRAKLSIKMPAGTDIEYDEPQVGIATLSVTVPNNNGNTVLTIDQDGKITLTAVNDVKIDASGQTVEVDADTINLGTANLTSSTAVIRKDDLTTFATTLQTWAAANFQTGSSTPPAPSVPPGSSVVFAKD